MNALLMAVTILSPVSKTDFMALSCQRTWGCVCGDVFDPLSCPYHAMEAQLKLLEDILGKEGLQGNFRIAPSFDGKVIEKDAVVKAIQMVAQATQLNMIAVDGGDAFTGHVWRISGSRLLARLGIQMSLIMLLARWGSAMRYVKDAPLKALTSDYKKATKGKLATQSASSSSSAEAPREKFKDDVLAKVHSILADKEN